MNGFDWKTWGKGALAGVIGAAVNSLATTGTLILSGTSVSLKMVGIAAGSAALTTLIGYLKRSPLGAIPVPQPNNIDGRKEA